MINLTKYINEINSWRRAVDEKHTPIELRMINYDEILGGLKSMGVEELEVNQEQMRLLTLFFCGSHNGAEDSAKAEIEGKLDKLMGIKLKLI